jgi:cell division protein FtsI (penicillin-binding protein 3)
MERLNVGNLNLSASRIRILIIFILTFFLLFTFRLIQIQGIQASEYRNKAANEMESTRAIPAARGEITDINGVDFARSVSAINIVVDQTQITDAAATANFAAPYLGMTVAQVQSAISGTRRYAMVAKSAKPAVWRNLSDAVGSYNAALSKENFDKRIVGFFAERNYIREYPSGSLVSSLVGFVRQDGIGATGIESSLNSTISGTDGRYSFARGLGAEIPGSQNEIIAAKKGTSIRLTIDRDVQWVAAKAIQEAVANAGATSGTLATSGETEDSRSGRC